MVTEVVSVSGEYLPAGVRRQWLVTGSDRGGGIECAMASSANWYGDYNPWISQPSKDSAIATLRTNYPRTVFPLLTADVAWAMLRGTPGFDIDNPDGRDRAYVMLHWIM